MAIEHTAKSGGDSEDLGKVDTWLDRAVRRYPVWTFAAVGLLGGALFIGAHYLTRNYLAKFFVERGSTAAEYVGAAFSIVVALAGALVSIMLARLALKLGYQAKAEAERSNEIQDQVRKFSDPRSNEIREGAKAAASLDLLGTLLREYSAELFRPKGYRPVEPTRLTYRRVNDLLAQPDFYLFCSHLLGATVAAEEFAKLQSAVYESASSLGSNDRTRESRAAEKVAVDIASFSRLIDRGKADALRERDHVLNAFAVDLGWEGKSSRLGGCEDAARQMLMRIRGANEYRDKSSWAGLVGPSKLIEVFLLEPDLEDFLKALRTEAAELGGKKIERFDSLRHFSAQASEFDSDVCILIARWDDVLTSSPEVLASEERGRLVRIPSLPLLPIEDKSIWAKAAFIAKNPRYEAALSQLMADVRFLRGLSATSIEDVAHLRAESNEELQIVSRNVADESEENLCLLEKIHGLVEQLRKQTSAKPDVVLPDFDCYSALDEFGGDGPWLVLVRPVFSSISIGAASPDSESQEGYDSWLYERLGKVGQLERRWYLSEGRVS